MSQPRESRICGRRTHNSLVYKNMTGNVLSVTFLPPSTYGSLYVPSAFLVVTGRVLSRLLGRNRLVADDGWPRRIALQSSEEDISWLCIKMSDLVHRLLLVQLLALALVLGDTG